MNWNPADMWDGLAQWLKELPSLLPARPSAILVVSAHWETSGFTVNNAGKPNLLFDYFGFPEETYRLTYPVSGEPALALRAAELLEEAQLPVSFETARGLDHGVFIPLKLIFPQADLPVVQISLDTKLSAGQHLRLGKSLAPLRSENVLIIGSGMSYHNMRGFSPDSKSPSLQSTAFDNWLNKTVSNPLERDLLLSNWQAAPEGRHCHPREEHLLPLHVVVGAAGADGCVSHYSGAIMGTAQSGFVFS